MKRLRIFRLENGTRVPYVLELDSLYTVINEYPVPSHEADLPPAVQHRPASNAMTAVASWATESITDNPIPGTDDLRSAFFAEKAALYKSHEEKGTQCPGCEVGRLLRKYRDMLQAGGHLAQLMSP